MQIGITGENNMTDESDKKRVGSYWIDDTNAHTANCQGFLVITATVLTSISYRAGYEGPNTDVGAVLTGKTLPAGTYLPIPFKAIKLASGSILAYRS